MLYEMTTETGHTALAQRYARQMAEYFDYAIDKPATQASASELIVPPVGSPSDTGRRTELRVATPRPCLPES